MPRGPVEATQVRVAEAEVTAETVMVPGWVGGVPDATASGGRTITTPVMATMTTTMMPESFRTLSPCLFCNSVPWKALTLRHRMGSGVGGQPAHPISAST